MQEKLLASNITNAHLVVDLAHQGKLCSQARCVCAPEKLMKNCEASGKKSDERNQNNYVSYAKRPVSFISCGTMKLDFATGTQAADSTGTIASEKVDEKNSSKLGAFEMHTRELGSRVMAKMGFVEGGGLGKDGRGIVHPIKALIRPRSLGLGVQLAGNKSHTKQVEASLEGFDRQQSGLDPG
ncbi:uncharacterized protein [Typha latifolia]|uniref:uncharacterized protein isoform X1 n=1 Tax=Typha latifolia TaxID=4733 RepID=UPI003C2D0501